MAVPQVTPQARRAQNGMPVELLYLFYLPPHRSHWGMSTKDQILSSELHGEALLTAKRPELPPLIRPTS